jgi:hypothetical protein
MSERFIVLEPRANLLEVANHARESERALLMVLIRLGRHAIDLTENSKGELEAIEKFDIDFDSLEITQGKFLIDKINKSRTVGVAEDGRMSKIVPEHKAKGVCTIGKGSFPQPAILHIPGEEKKYAASIELFNPDNEYLQPKANED